jgi:rhodanese-related sulfurtransferase
MMFIEQNPAYILFGLLIGWLIWQRLAAPALSGVKNISAAEYVIMSMQPHTLLDVRQDVEWASGHAEAAMHVPLSELKQRSNEIVPDQPVVVICASGNRSAMAATLLAKTGFTEVYNFSGGMSAWDGTLQPVKRNV